MNKYEAVFKELNFTQRETAVYLALLELGPSTVGPIVTKTKLQHSKVYETLEKLQEKGLVSFVLRGKIKQFQSANPKEILLRLVEKEQQFQEIMKELEAKQAASKEKQSVTMYEGFAGVKSMYNMLIEELTKDDFYWVFAFRKEYVVSQEARLFLNTVHLRLAEKKIEDRLIGHVSVKQDIKNNYTHVKKMNMRFINLALPQGLVVTRDRVINIMWGERPTATEIRSKQIAEEYKEFFEEIWKKAKP